MTYSADFRSRLESTGCIIESIRQQFKCANISIGVLHKGMKPFKNGFGSTPVPGHDGIAERTLYRTGLLTQPLTGITLGLLEQAGRISWDAPVSTYLKELETHPYAGLDTEITIRDLLSHSPELAAVPWAIRGKYGSKFADFVDIEQVVNQLPVRHAGGVNLQNTEWAYALLASVIDRFSDNPWSYCVDNIIGDLGYPRTYLNHQVDRNCNRPYYTVEDGAQVLLDNTETRARSHLNGSGSVLACVQDMLDWCSFLNMAFNSNPRDEECAPMAIFPVTSGDESTLTKKRLLRAARQIQRPASCDGSCKTNAWTHGMGLYKLQMPSKSINTVSNPEAIVMENDILGAGSRERRIIGNTSDLGTYTSTCWTFPETNSAIVVLSNGNSVNGDATNIIAQVLAQALFDLQPRMNLLAIAECASADAISLWTATYKEWYIRRHRDIPPKPLNTYAGVYHNTDLQMTLTITISPETQRATGDLGRIHTDGIGRMEMSLNNLPSQIFTLYNYYGNHWTFMPASRDDCVKQGYGQYIQRWNSFIVKFDEFQDGRFETVRWYLDPDEGVRAFVFRRPEDEDTDLESSRASSEMLPWYEELRILEVYGRVKSWTNL